MSAEFSTLREEVINVKLAELLNKSGIVSVPESIIYRGSKRKMPDITIGEYLGVSAIIEGKIFENSQTKSRLEIDCIRRIDEGISELVIAVIYPNDIKHSEFSKLDEILYSTNLEVNIFSESGNTSWTPTDVNGLTEIIRRVYENLVKESIVDEAVELLKTTIEDVSAKLLVYKGARERLESLLLSPTITEDL